MIADTPKIPGILNRLGIVVVASSTGGPAALDELFRSLPDNGPPILIVQHMPTSFLPRMAARLDRTSAYRVRMAEDDGAISRSTAFVAPGGHHLDIVRGRLTLDASAAIGALRPRADVTMAAAARLFRHRALGVVLSGLGNDGLSGARHIVDAGGRVLTQDRFSAAVDGMPGAVRSAGLSSYDAPPEMLAKEICETC